MSKIKEFVHFKETGDHEEYYKIKVNLDWLNEIQENPSKIQLPKNVKTIRIADMLYGIPVNTLSYIQDKQYIENLFLNSKYN